jgi:hypothetical protein
MDGGTLPLPCDPHPMTVRLSWMAHPVRSNPPQREAPVSQ